MMKKSTIVLVSVSVIVVLAVVLYLFFEKIGISAAKLVTYFMHWPTLITESSVVLSFLVCFVTGVFFGYYPALKASRLNPIEALRYE